MYSNRFKGYFYVILSAIMFYIITVFVKLITQAGNIPGIEVSFFRFLVGLIIINIIKIRNKKGIKPKNRKAVFARAFLNTGAVIVFFLTIELSTTTKANIYNLTYPVFVAIIAPFFLKEERFTLKKLIAVMLTFIGAYLVAGVNIGKIGLPDLLGISMGVISGFAIVSLRFARMTDTPFTILYYLMSVGTIVTAFLSIWSFRIPSQLEFIYLILMGSLSFGGQFALTKGFKYVTAVEGSLLSASRIFIAAVCGTLFLGEPFSLQILGGGTLIFLSIVMLNSNKKIG